MPTMIRLKNGEVITRSEFDQLMQNLRELYDRDLVAFCQLVRLWLNPEHIVPESVNYGNKVTVKSNCRSMLRFSQLPLNFDGYGHGHLDDPLGAVLQTVISFSPTGPKLISPYS